MNAALSTTTAQRTANPEGRKPFGQFKVLATKIRRKLRDGYLRHLENYAGLRVYYVSGFPSVYRFRGEARNLMNFYEKRLAWNVYAARLSILQARRFERRSLDASLHLDRARTHLGAALSCVRNMPYRKIDNAVITKMFESNANTPRTAFQMMGRLNILLNALKESE